MFSFFFLSSAADAPELPEVNSDMVFYVRDLNAVLANFPDAWDDFDRLRFIGPPKGLLDEAYTGVLSPNEQLAPLFCRACWLDAAIYLASKAEDYEQAA